MSDETRTCIDCGNSFTWSSGEQRYYQENNLSEPKRCPDCRSRRRAERTSGDSGFSAPSAGSKVATPGPATGSGPSRPPTPVSRPGQVTPSPARPWGKNPYIVSGALGLGLVLLITVGTIIWLGFSLWILIFAWLVAINIVTLGIYRYDKEIAGTGRTRVPEATLLLLALLGGWPAAFVAMYMFEKRHKTQKISFQLIYWAIVAFDLIISIYFIWFR